MRSVSDSQQARGDHPRIAVVTETYPPEINGVSKSLAVMVDALMARGYDIQLIRPRQASGDEENRTDFMWTIPVPGMQIPMYRDLRFGLPVKGRLLRTWRQSPPSLVHVVTEGPLGWAAVRAACILNLPVICDFRTNFHMYADHYRLGPLRGIIETYLRRLHNRADRTLVPTLELQERLAKTGFQRVEVVGRGIDTALFSPAKRCDSLRTSWGLQPHHVAVMYVGRLAPEKNIDLVVAAFRAMHFRNPDCRLVFVGDGPMRTSLAARLPDAHFAGMRTGEDLARHYACGDVFLFASTTETFGNVVLEAVASGLAFVGYDYAAAGTYLRHRDSALLATFDHDQVLIHWAEYLAARPELIDTLGGKAREVAETCTWSKVVDRLETTIREVMCPDGRQLCATFG